MVILGGLELVAAGYLINRHAKNKQEARRLAEEEGQHYRIHSPNSAGPGRRRSHSHDRKHHRRHSHDRRHSLDRRDDGKHKYERPQSARPQASSVPPPMYAPAHQTRPVAMRPASAMASGRPAAEQFPVTGYPPNWQQGQPGPSQSQQGLFQGQPGPSQGYQGQRAQQAQPHPQPNPQPQAAQQIPSHMAPYYRDPAQADVKYGFRDGEDADRGRAQLRPEEMRRRVGRDRSGSNLSVRFDVPDRRQPGDEPPPAYRP